MSQDNAHLDPRTIGRTRILRPGDRLVFRVIPPGQTEPIDALYYEELTDKTFVTPKGHLTRLNSLGDVGKPPQVYFSYTQDEDGTIFLHGMLVQHPADPSQIMPAEWVVSPETGYTLNYPGAYTVGQRWDSTFKTQSPDGSKVVSIDTTNHVEELEEVTVPAGRFAAFRIVSHERNGDLNSISWFAPELGVNVKKISYAPPRPGYELVETHFADAD